MFTERQKFYQILLGSIEPYQLLLLWSKKYMYQYLANEPLNAVGE